MTPIPVEKNFKRSQTLRIGVSEWKVLLALAYDGPQNMYAISKKNKILYPVVHRAASNLEKNGWVEVTATPRSEKNVTTKIYSLTREGLLWVFSRIPKKTPAELYDLPDEKTAFGRRMERVEKTESPFSLEDLKTHDGVSMHLLFYFDENRIAQANAELFPLVFIIWSSYRKSDLASSLSMIFPDAAFSTLIEYYYDYKGLRTKFQTLEKLFTYEAYHAILESTSKVYPAQESDIREIYLKEILTIYEQTPEIQDILNQVLSELEATSKGALNFLERIRAALSQKTGLESHRTDWAKLGATHRARSAVG